MPRLSQKDRVNFLEENPNPPWICHFCKKKIWKLGPYGDDNLHIHHITKIKVAPAHSGCHHKHHSRKCKPGCNCARHKNYANRRKYATGREWTKQHYNEVYTTD